MRTTNQINFVGWVISILTIVFVAALLVFTPTSSRSAEVCDIDSHMSTFYKLQEEHKDDTFFKVYTKEESVNLLKVLEETFGVPEGWADQVVVSTPMQLSQYESAEQVPAKIGLVKDDCLKTIINYSIVLWIKIEQKAFGKGV